jgi:hypothetical protein
MLHLLQIEMKIEVLLYDVYLIAKYKNQNVFLCFVISKLTMFLEGSNSFVLSKAY